MKPAAQTIPVAMAPAVAFDVLVITQANQDFIDAEYASRQAEFEDAIGVAQAIPVG